MNCEIRCLVCGATGWVRGSDEPDTNAFYVNENDSRIDDICTHISNGQAYEGTGKVEYDDGE